MTRAWNHLQLGDLMEALHRMEPHYIRCIKPNSFNRPMDFENLNVLHQVCVHLLAAAPLTCLLPCCLLR